MKRTPEPRYFATWHYSELTETMVLAYWYRSDRGKHAGKIRPWPPNRSGFNYLLHKDVPESLGSERDTPERTAWVAAWFDERHVMEREALAAIEKDPQDCAAAFASLQAFCCCCGKGVTDERSIAYGIGPECRAGLPAETITAISSMVARYRADRSSGGT